MPITFYLLDWYLHFVTFSTFTKKEENFYENVIFGFCEQGLIQKKINISSTEGGQIYEHKTCA